MATTLVVLLSTYPPTVDSSKIEMTTAAIGGGAGGGGDVEFDSRLIHPKKITVPTARIAHVHAIML